MKLVQINDYIYREYNRPTNVTLYRILFNKNEAYKTTLGKNVFTSIRAAINSLQRDTALNTVLKCKNNKRYKTIIKFNNINEVKMQYPEEFI